MATYEQVVAEYGDDYTNEAERSAGYELHERNRVELDAIFFPGDPVELSGVDVAVTVAGDTLDRHQVTMQVWPAVATDAHLCVSIPTPMLGVVEQLEVAIPRAALEAILGGAR